METAGFLEVQGEVTLLGRGSIGVTYRTIGPGVTPEYAAKLIATAGDGALVKGICQMAAQWAQLSSDAILPVRQVLDGHESVAVLTDFQVQGSLATATANNPLPFEQALNLAGQLTGALSAIHGADLCHGNIKATNVLQVGEASWGLVDGGYASVLSLRPGLETLRSTREALESWDRRALRKGQADDVRAIGAMSWLAMMGCPLHFEMDCDRLRSNQLSGIPEVWVEVINRSLASDWRRRPTARSLYDTIAAIRTEAPRTEAPRTEDHRAEDHRAEDHRAEGHRAEGPRILQRASMVTPARLPTRLRLRRSMVSRALFATGGSVAALALVAAGVRYWMGRPATSAAGGPASTTTRIVAAPFGAHPVHDARAVTHPVGSCHIATGGPGPTGTLVVGGIGRDGCPQVVEWVGNVATVVMSRGRQPERYALGRPGDVLLVGNWNCVNPGPALYRPSTGDVYFFAAWSASPIGPIDGQRVRSGIPGGQASVSLGSNGCDGVKIQRNQKQ